MNKSSIIIVTYNNQESIGDCLSSLKKYEPIFEIIVLDNNSTDKTVEEIKRVKDVKLIKSDVNLGFSKGNNQAVKEAHGEYLIFLNPDTELLEFGDLSKLVNLLEENQSYGLVAPLLVDTKGNIQKSVRKLPTIWGVIKEYLFGIQNQFSFYIPEVSGLSEVESVVGACMAIKRRNFEEVGRFDEKYFLYFEDLQLCKDIKEKLKLKIGFCSDVKIKHLHGVSGKAGNTNRLSQESAKKYYGSLKLLLINYIGRIGNKIFVKS